MSRASNGNLIEESRLCEVRENSLTPQGEKRAEKASQRKLCLCWILVHKQEFRKKKKLKEATLGRKNKNVGV